jgi:hypothetical protein
MCFINGHKSRDGRQKRMVFSGSAVHVCFYVICELSLILNCYGSWNRQDSLDANAHTIAVCKYLILGSASTVEDLVRHCEANQSMVCAYFFRWKGRPKGITIHPNSYTFSHQESLPPHIYLRSIQQCIYCSRRS